MFGTNDVHPMRAWTLKDSAYNDVCRVEPYAASGQ